MRDRHGGIGPARIASAAVATTAAASVTGSLAAAAYFARRVLTPERNRPDDTEILAVQPGSLVLAATPETITPGRFGLWLSGGAGHARVGEILAADPKAGTVERQLLGVDSGTVQVGPARFDGYYFAGTPHSALGLDYADVEVDSEIGPLPAWVVPAPLSPPSSGPPVNRWAVLVHGRGATREETLRAIPALHRAGWVCLVPSYRNDSGVPPGPDGRYNLGLSEWRDIESAVRYALTAGAEDIVVSGWSMGGAIALQFLDRSSLSSSVSRLILDGPVVDWGDVLDHHAALHRVPPLITSLACSMMGKAWGKRLVGVHESVDIARTDWVARSGELTHPILLIHSADDEFVPVGPSRVLAMKRPDLVEFHEWRIARHCKEWNTDPARWERIVTAFMGRERATGVGRE